MRLITQRPEKQAGCDRPPIDVERPGPEQRRGKKCVLPQAERPEHGGKRQHRDERAKTALAEDAAHNDQKKNEGDRLEDQESHNIGQTGEGRAKQHEDRRVIKKSIFDAGCGRPLFRGIVRRLVVGEFGRAGVGQASGGIEADKIGAHGRAERHDPAVCSGDKKQKSAELDCKQDRAIRQDAVAVQRVVQHA